MPTLKRNKMAKARKNLLAKTIKKTPTLNPKPVVAAQTELSKKVAIKKTTLIEDEKIDKATKKIHSKRNTEKSIRFTMDIPEDMYYEIKMVMIKKKIKTMKEYFLMLSEKDRS